MTGDSDLLTAVAVLEEFLGGDRLTAAVGQLEQALCGADRDEAEHLIASAGITTELLGAAVTARAALGRVSDLIHVAGIALALPRLLQEGERITAPPSLAAGNDPGRPHDLLTDRRAAEFKFSQWKGNDTARKRGTFKDLVLLATCGAERAELLIVGPKPAHFLRNCTSRAAWGLEQAKGARAKFLEAFGPGALDLSIAEFTRTHAAHVVITDVRTLLPEKLAELLTGGAVLARSDARVTPTAGLDALR